jgi:adenosylcobinamide kinase/adenosylcobinamide-phosphate guanylyltransferase
VPFDEEMKDRIQKHRERRGNRWETLEIYRDFESLSVNSVFDGCSKALLDCVTVMLSNWFFDNGFKEETPIGRYDDIEKLIIKELDMLIDICREKNKKLVIVTNELGMGIVPIDRVSRMYRDMAGRINQHLAERADRVILAVSGISVVIKE